MKNEKKSMKIFCYSDQVILIKDNENESHGLLCQFETTAEKFNVPITVDITESIMISKELIKCKVAINNKPIQQNYVMLVLRK